MQHHITKRQSISTRNLQSSWSVRVTCWTFLHQHLIRFFLTCSFTRLIICTLIIFHKSWLAYENASTLTTDIVLSSFSLYYSVSAFKWTALLTSSFNWFVIIKSFLVCCHSLFSFYFYVLLLPCPCIFIFFHYLTQLSHN